MRADLFAFRRKFDGGLSGARRIDGEIDREVFAGEDGAGNADGFGLELRLRRVPASAMVSIETPSWLGLPGGASGRAGVFVAVGDERDAMQHARGQRGQRLADGRFEIGAAAVDAGRAREI